MSGGLAGRGYVLRGRGYVKALADLEASVVTQLGIAWARLRRATGGASRAAGR